MRRLWLVLLALPAPLNAQNPFAHPADAVEVRYAAGQPVVNYVVHVDSTDLSGFGVEIRLSNLPDTFSLALPRSSRYVDRFWRYVEGLRVETAAGPGSVTRVDSALWSVRAPGGAAIVRYRMHLPPPQAERAAWRPFLARDGGLVGGAHSFLYVIGQTLAPAEVTLDLPAGWNAATGLEPTSDPRTYFAPTVDILADSPILIGGFHDWHFFIDGVPHRVVYWSLLPTLPFDSTALVRDIESVARQAVSLFGRAPYREYSFLLQDDATGALEHLNSLTLGAPSADLARDAGPALAELAEKYFEAWNLMRIRPAEYAGVSWRGQPPAATLWWTEGISAFYADLLVRRAGLPAADSTRRAHLARLIGEYLGRGGYARHSAEAVSRAARAEPGALGDDRLSPRLQGELLGAMLDLTIRHATGGARSVDDVLREMNIRFAGSTGFTGQDIENTIAQVCGCQVRRFFDTYVRTAHLIAFDDYLRYAGLRATVAWGPARNDSGALLPDLRIDAWMPSGAGHPELLLPDPDGIWGKAGLHTGDRILRLNGAPIRSVQGFRAAISRLAMGQPAQLAIERDGRTIPVRVVIRGYDIPTVSLEETRGATAEQRALREAWEGGRTGG